MPKQLGPRGPSHAPERLLIWGALAIVGVHTCKLLVTAWRHSHFVGDDLYGFWGARTIPLRKFLFTPIDVHFVPLHRLISFLVLRVAPMNFALALGVLAAFHVATMVLLFLTLHRLRPGPWNAVLTALYGLHACLGPLFLWWTSGLHRLGCLCFVVLSLYCYGEYRSTLRHRWLAPLVVATACALGFYSKGALIPFYIVALEFALRRADQRPSLRIPFAAFGASAAVVVGYVFIWRATTIAPMHAVRHDLRFLAQFSWAGLQFLALTTFGFWGDPRVGVRLGIMGMWTLALVYTLARGRGAARAWLSLVGTVVLNTSVIAASAAKTDFFGLSLVFSDRYYFECSFLVVLFGAAAFRETSLGKWERATVATAPRRFALSAVALSLLTLISVESDRSFHRIMLTAYPDHDVARTFLTNVMQSLRNVPPLERRTLHLRDSPVPVAVIPRGNLLRRNSELLRLMGEHVRLTPNGPYWVTPAGYVVFDGSAKLPPGQPTP